MSQNRDLIDNIKANFARKSSAQLQEIMRADNPERWSAEAIAAAGEVFQDRLAGRAEEPQGADEEPAPPPYYYVPEEMALGALAGLLTGFLVIPYYKRAVKNPDRPLPFGPRVAWLALDTTDTAAVAQALGLRGVRDATWRVGVEAAYQSFAFVTPPLGDWTLAVSTALFPPDRVAGYVKPLLERLSRQFGDAQYFCTQQDIGLHAWARRGRGGWSEATAGLVRRALPSGTKARQRRKSATAASISSTPLQFANRQSRGRRKSATAVALS